MSSYYEKMLATGEVKCIDEEIPFEIPKGWEWCRLNDLYNFIDYRGATPHKLSKGIPLITAKNVKQGYLDYTVKDFISSEEYSNRLSRGVSHKGDILFTTEAPLGNVAIADLDVYSAGQRLITLQAYIQCYTNNDMFMFFMLSPLFQEMVMSYKTGTTVAGIKASKLKEVLIPTPPISEQSRIVKKIQTLLPFIEKYSRSQTLLNIFNTEIKDKLRKSFLQEAIQGNLVPQIASEGTAHELLEQIKTEKQKLVKDGKLKKSALATSVIYKGDDNRYYEQIGKKCLDITDEIPFDIPENWQWIKLDQGISLLSGRDLEPSQYNDLHHGIPYITGASNFVNSNLIINRWTEAPITISNKGDLLLTCKGTIGSMAFNDIGQIHIARQVMAITSYGIDLKYIKCFLQSNLSILEKNANSMIPGISRSTLLGMLFPLPPFKEQQRIVAQIEKLFEQLH